jgi:hypothetical protein
MNASMIHVGDRTSIRKHRTAEERSTERPDIEKTLGQSRSPLALATHTPTLTENRDQTLPDALGMAVTAPVCGSTFTMLSVFQTFANTASPCAAAAPAPAAVRTPAGRRRRRRAPGVAGVAHDGEHPRARVAAPIAVEGAQVGLLHDVLRVMVVAGQPARQIVAGTEVRHYDALEAA